jgi:hypothetical protein
MSTQGPLLSSGVENYAQERRLRLSVSHIQSTQGLGTSIWLHSYLAQATVRVSYPRANKGTLATLHDRVSSFNRGPKPSPLQDPAPGVREGEAPPT